MFVIGLIVTSKVIFIFLYSAFEYSLGLGRNPLRYFQTILFLECTHLKWPTFILGPEKVKDKSGYILGDPDANFAANPYVEKIRTFFTRPRIKYFESIKSLFADGQGNYLNVLGYQKETSQVKLSHFYTTVKITIKNGLKFQFSLSLSINTVMTICFNDTALIFTQPGLTIQRIMATNTKPSTIINCLLRFKILQ